MNLERYENCSISSLGSDYSISTTNGSIFSDSDVVLSPLCGDDYSPICNKLDLGMTLQSPTSPGNTNVGRSRSRVVGLLPFGNDAPSFNHQEGSKKRNAGSSGCSSHGVIQSSSELMERITQTIHLSPMSRSSHQSTSVGCSGGGIEILLEDLETLRERNQALLRNKRKRRKL